MHSTAPRHLTRKNHDEHDIHTQHHRAAGCNKQCGGTYVRGTPARTPKHKKTNFRFVGNENGKYYRASKGVGVYTQRRRMRRRAAQPAARTKRPQGRLSMKQQVDVRRDENKITVISEDADVRMGRKDKECGAIGVMSVAGTSGETWATVT